MKRFFAISLIMVIILTSLSAVEAKTSKKIIFKDRHLFNALCKFYEWTSDFTQEDASALTEKSGVLILKKVHISELEGLQYFKNVLSLYIEENDLKDLKPLTKLNHLTLLDISNNLKKGTEFENLLATTGRITNLNTIILNNNGLKKIDFLKRMGYINKYYRIKMSDNKIVDISVLRDATNLASLDLSNNRIQDVSALANLDKLTSFLDLRDNCIIDYSPVRHLFDKMYEDFDVDIGMSRYDYYTNPFNFKFNGTMIDFPYLTAYYKDEAYAEAKPLFKAFGGNAKYDKKAGILTCKYGRNTYVFKDFSNIYTINGKSKKMSLPMRHMQYNLAYVPVKDICKMLGFSYTEIYPKYDEAYWETHDDNSISEPILVEIKSH